jgi:hypothetical protein
MANAIALAALAVSALSAVAAIATAIFTLAAAVAAIIYVVLTHRLWREAAKDREAQLMLRLMEGYDNLRDAIDELRGWYLECAEGGVDACERFKEATGEDNPDERTLWIDAQRFRVSRFFVTVRKLTRAGYLSEDIVWQALESRAISEVFLELVDPLDNAKVGLKYAGVDRAFYQGLLRKHSRQTESDNP